MHRRTLFMLRLLFCSTFICISNYASAQKTSLQEASNVALNFIKNHEVQHSSKARAKGQVSSAAPELVFTSSSPKENGLYIFNYDSISNGFVIVGNHKNSYEIIGFSDNSRFDYISAPNALKWWIQEFKRNGAATLSAVRSSKSSVNPLLTTYWAQSEPFNTCIPTLGSQYSPFVTGCTATAIAQIMKFWEYPIHGKGSNQYTINYGIKNLTFSANFENTYYDWNNMLDDYSFVDYNNQQAKAVGELMYNVGVAQETLYGDMSSADDRDGAKALIENFTYDKSLTRASREFYTDDEWEDMIYNELRCGRPVLYGGTQVVGDEVFGHNFVCHGYDANTNLYAINWGWGGMYDGYFALTGSFALDPSAVSMLSSQSKVRVNDTDQEVTYSIGYSYNNQDCDKKPNLTFELEDNTDDSGAAKRVYGVVADGKSSITIRTKNVPSEKCQYTCHWELNENVGKLSNANSWDAVYTAPEDYPQKDNNGAYPIKAKVTYTNGKVSYSDEVEIKIYRVPVLLVHGLGDSGGSFSSLIRYLKSSGYSDLLVKAVDYSAKNCDHFNENSNVVSNAANEMIKQMHANKIACSKVDVVGHSMGGLLTKYAINSAPSLFHKVITLNTPHGGSQFGDLMTDPIIEKIFDYNRNHISYAQYASLNPLEQLKYSNEDLDNLPNPIWRRVINLIYWKLKPNGSDYLRDGAVNDLSVDKDAIASLNKPISSVKCHAIATTTPKGLLKSLIDWSHLWKALGYSSPDNFLNDLFNNEASDLIVPVSSQYGGLTGVSAGLINGSDHLSIGKSEVQARIASLLKSEMKSSVFSNGFSTVKGLKYDMSELESVKVLYPEIFSNKAKNVRSQNTRTSSIIDNNLIIKNDISYQTGDSILSYTIINSDSYDNVSFACIFQNNIIYYENQSQGSVTLPSHVNGDFIVMCEGKNRTTGEWHFNSDTISINTQNSSDLERIEFLFDTLYVKKNGLDKIDVIGFWKDGTSTVVNPSNLQTNDDNVASINSSFEACGHNTGLCTLKAKFLNKECESIISVYDENDEFISSPSDNEGYTTSQVIYLNIKPDQGGAYVINPAARDNVILYKNNSETPLTNVQIDRSSTSDTNYNYAYTPYNDGLTAAKFQYGVIAKNLVSGIEFHKYGGSTDNLSTKELPAGSFYSKPIYFSFNTSFIPYNGIYELLPAYSVDGGTNWYCMQYLANQNIPKITITGGQNAERVNLPLNLSSTSIQVGRTAEIEYPQYYRGNIRFESLTPSFASINSNGTILALSKGAAHIRVTVDGDDNYLPSIEEFYVSIEEHIITPLLLTITKDKLNMGETAQINIPSDYHGELSFSVTPIGVIDITPSGVISCLSEGKASITVTSSSTNDYYETTNSFTVETTSVETYYGDGLTIQKQPNIGVDNIIFEGNSNMTVVFSNDSDEDQDFVTYYRIYLDGGYCNCYAWFSLESGESYTYTTDLLSYSQYMTPGKTYTCKFFKDSNYSEAMNIETVTFVYGEEETITMQMANSCSTLSLPFDSKIPADLQAFEILAFYNNTLALKEVYSLERNHSYIIYGNKNSYTFTGVKIPSSDNPRYGFMTGLHKDCLIPKDKYVIENNIIKKVINEKYGDRWSAYMTLPTSLESMNIPIEGVVSGINNLVQDSNYSDKIYDINGIRQTKLKPGINIIVRDGGTTQKILKK